MTKELIQRGDIVNKQGGPLRIGVVGTGYAAREIHLPLLTKFPDVKIVAICDKDESKLKEVSRYVRGANLYSELDQMLSRERLDLVDICTPPDSHASLAIQVLESGCNCMVEKPMAMTISDADRMIETAKQKNLALYVIHNYSFMPCVRKAKRMVATGEIGQLVSVEVKYLASIEKERYFAPNHWCHHLPGGILSTEITPHLVMLILDFLDSKRPKITQVFKEKLSPYPHIQADELRAIIKGDQVMATLSLSYNCPFKQLSIYLVGTHGYIYVNGNSQAVVKCRATNYSNRDVINRGRESLSEIYQLFTGLLATSINVILGKYAPLVEGHRYLMSCCWRDLRGESKYPVDLDSCREVIRIMEELFR